MNRLMDDKGNEGSEHRAMFMAIGGVLLTKGRVFALGKKEN